MGGIVVKKKTLDPLLYIHNKLPHNILYLYISV